MYNSIRFKIIISFISVLVVISSIQDTYAKYKTDASGTTNMTIARWNITVNNQDILSNNYITNTLTPYFVDNNHIADGVIAPSAVGYFDVNIDCTKVDVSFNYRLTTGIDPTSSVSDLSVIGYALNGGAIVPLTGTMDINESILVSSTEKIRNMRIYIKWDDSETSSMNNASDTLAALSGGLAKMNVNLHFTQEID